MSPSGGRLLTLLASDSPNRRIRLMHRLIAGLVYFGIALLLAARVQQGGRNSAAPSG